jgi:hypothetical protein
MYASHAARWSSIVLMASATAAWAEPAPDPEGLWGGVILYVPGVTEIEILVDLARDHEGKLAGTISVPSQDLRHVALTALAQDGNEIGFTFTRYSTRAKMDVVSPFRGEIGADGRTISGQFVEGGVNPYRFELERIGEAGSEPPPITPPPLHDLSDDGEELAALFNEHADKVRLVLMVSPTCPLCTMNARLVRRYLIDETDDEDLRVFVVWGPMQNNEERKDAVAATANLADGRVTHFWTPRHTLAQAYMKPLGLADDLEPAWDTYLLYDRGVRWGGAPPAPTFFMYVEKPLPEEGVLNVETLARKSRELLAADRTGAQ